MTTYRVAPDGDDTRSAVTAQNPLTPWGSIYHALKSGALQFGDTVELMAPVGETTHTYNASSGIWKSGVPTRYIETKDVVVSGAGYVIIKPYPGHIITIDMPNDASGQLFKFNGAWIFDDLIIRNTGSVSTPFLGISTQTLPTNIIWRGCDIDNNNVNSYGVLVYNTANLYDVNLTFLRSRIEHVGSSTVGFIRSGIDFANKTKRCKVNLNASVLSDSELFFLTFSDGSCGPGDLSIINSVVDTGNDLTLGLTSQSIVITKNSLINANIKSVTSTPSNWSIKNNCVFTPVTLDPGSELDQIFFAADKLIPVDATNTYLPNPGFTDATSGDYSLLSTSMAIGRGDDQYLPDGGDINGDPWIGNDIGPFANPVSTALPVTINPGTICFIGDSIAEGAGVRAVVNGILNKTVIGDGILGAAIGGSGGQSAKWLIDRAAITWGPEYAVFITYHNNFYYNSNNPPGLTASIAAEDVEVAMRKAESWGITPIFLGMAGVKADLGVDQSSKAIAFNDAMETICVANGWEHRSIIDWMMRNQNWSLAVASGGYYQIGGLAAEIHPASEGYDFIDKVLRQTFISSSSKVAVINQGRAKYPLTIVSGTGPADWVVKLPAAPELIAALGLDSVYFSVNGVPKEITWATHVDDDQVFLGTKKGAVYATVQTDAAIIRRINSATGN